MTEKELSPSFPASTLTCHGVKQLVGLKVSESREAAGTPEGGAVGGVSLICLDASSHVIQFILDHVDKYPKETDNHIGKALLDSTYCHEE